MTLIWVIAFLGFLLVELFTVGLISIWFAIGALAALITTFITESILIQCIIFVLVSIVAIIVTHPVLKKFKVVTFEPTNIDRIIGKMAEVTKEIRPDEYGEVQIFGNTWLAISEKKQVIGAKVIIKKIEGNKLIVVREGEE